MDKIVDGVRRDDMQGAIVYRLWTGSGREIIFIRWDDCGLALNWIAMLDRVFGEVVRCDRGASTLGAVCVGTSAARVGAVVGLMLGWIVTLRGGTLGGGTMSGSGGNIVCLAALLNILASCLMAFKWVDDKGLRGQPELYCVGQQSGCWQQQLQRLPMRTVAFGYVGGRNLLWLKYYVHLWMGYRNGSINNGP
eukprot:7076003-Ditylum_brightwellii.AAC.1